jgi:hypothetical protein
LCRARRRDHFGQTLGLDFRQRIRGNRLDFRHHEMGAVFFDHLPQAHPVEHRKNLRVIRDLHRRGIRIGIARDHLDPVSLKLDHHLFPQLSRAAEHHACRGFREWRADGWGVAHAPW